MGFGPFVNFIKFQKAHRSALVMNIFCCNPKMMKGLIAFQFIAYRGGDKNGNFLNAILLLSLVKLYTVCWGHPRTDMIASLKQSFLAITLSQKNISLKNFPLTCIIIPVNALPGRNDDSHSGWYWGQWFPKLLISHSEAMARNTTEFRHTVSAAKKCHTRSLSARKPFLSG